MNMLCHIGWCEDVGIETDVAASATTSLVCRLPFPRGKTRAVPR